MSRTLRRWPQAVRMTPAFAALCVLLAAVLPGRPPLRRVFAPGHYRPIATHDAALAALRLVPPDGSVIAQAAIAPHLSQRERIYVLRDDDRQADVVIASTVLSPWPLANTAEVSAVLERRRQGEYETVFDKDGWTVLARRQQTSSDAAAPRP
jgi:hypothetical protein